MDWKIELIHVPVTDVDRAKEFYTMIGFNPDHDHQVSDELRFVQMTPPGSACSIAFGTGTGMGSGLEPGQQNSIQVVVPDADEALSHLRGLGVEASGVDEQPWGRFVTFADPDGNTWTLQQIPDYGAQ
ncbi:VOC family protein [Microbacterium arabinogalactanolyticum]|uniref:VOC family protein n=1 Tax=Microbacterium arabinogalactanolyticum TaxID=69365 RepID=UPI004043B18F